jgi:hypothetical protein
MTENRILDGNGNRVSIKEYIDGLMEAHRQELLAKVGEVDRVTTVAAEGLRDRISATDRAAALVAAALGDKVVAADRAAQLVAEGLKDKFEAQNNWRALVEKMLNTFMKVEEFTRLHETICDRVTKVELWLSRQEGKASQSSIYIALVVNAIFAIVVGLALRFLGK